MDSWRLRPEAATAIPNLFLASDYVRTHTDLATMEGANEAARRAVNAILDARAATPAPRCRDLAAARAGRARSAARSTTRSASALGLPWDGGLLTVAAAAVKAGGPLLGPVTALIDAGDAGRRTAQRARRCGAPRLRRRSSRDAAGRQNAWARVRDEVEAASTAHGLEAAAAACADGPPSWRAPARRRRRAAAAATPDPTGPAGLLRAARLVPRHGA